MKKLFTINGWQIELGWRGLQLSPSTEVDRFREIKLEPRIESLESWMQAADAFVPGRLLFAEVPARRQKERLAGARITRRRRVL